MLCTMRINRNILECKYLNSFRENLCKEVLIETYWNVNDVEVIIFDEFNPVLIETYWNVNKEISVADYLDYWVLIETYWNVNYILLS